MPEPLCLTLLPGVRQKAAVQLSAYEILCYGHSAPFGRTIRRAALTYVYSIKHGSGRRISALFAGTRCRFNNCANKHKKSNSHD